MLIQHNVDRVESGVVMRYGTPLAVLPLSEVAARLGVTEARLLAAAKKD